MTRMGAHLVAEHTMDLQTGFYALEIMCRERLADKESNYRLAEAEEWTRLTLSCHEQDKEPVTDLAERRD
jgi:hypothetical protein